MSRAKLARADAKARREAEKRDAGPFCRRHPGETPIHAERGLICGECWEESERAAHADAIDWDPYGYGRA